MHGVYKLASVCTEKITTSKNKIAYIVLMLLAIERFSAFLKKIPIVIRLKIPKNATKSRYTAISIPDMLSGSNDDM